MELNRAAAIRSRKKKKQDEEQIRLHVDFLQQSNQHLKLKIKEYQQLFADQETYTTVLKANLYQVLVENEQIRALIKEKEVARASDSYALV